MSKRHKCDLGKCFTTLASGRLVKVCCNAKTNSVIATVLGYQPKTPEAKYKLASGEALARKHPSAFQIPEAVVRTSLRKGDMAKLIFIAGKGQRRGGERMWVEVASRSGTGAATRYRGILRNSPIHVNLKYGDRVEFAPKDVINVTSAALGYEPLNKREKKCASDFILEEMHELKKGRWKSRQQAIAVGLSRARREC